MKWLNHTCIQFIYYYIITIITLICVDYSQFSSCTLLFPTLPPGYPHPVHRSLSLPFQTPLCSGSGTVVWANSISRLCSDLSLPLWQEACLWVGWNSIWYLLWASPNTIQRNPDRVDSRIINRNGSAETPCSKTSRAQYVLWKVLANFLVFPVVFASMLTNTRSLLEKVQCSRVSMLVMLLFLLCLLHLALCSTMYHAVAMGNKFLNVVSHIYHTSLLS